MPVREGFSPTPSMVTSDPGRAAAATAGNAADEMSPGTTASRPDSVCPPSRPTVWSVTAHRNAERRERALRMVSCGRVLGDLGSASGIRPASSTALFTWALGTSGAKAIAVQMTAP